MEEQEIAKKEAGTSSAEAEGLPEHQEVAERMYLIEEATYTTAPEHMKILLKRIPEELLTPEKLIFALIYLLALECDFEHRINYLDPEDHPLLLLNKIGLYNFPRIKRLAHEVSIKWLLCSSGSFQERHLHIFHGVEKFTLVTNITADLLCLTITSKRTAGFSTALSIPRYVPIVHRQNILRSFRNLPELCLRLKNKLFIPTRDMFMQMNNFCRPYPSLIGIPDEVLLTILKLLPKKDRDVLNEILN